MSEHQFDTMECDYAEANKIGVSIGEILENAQIAARDTGWGKEEKERMKQFGYDDLDMVKAWYS